MGTPPEVVVTRTVYLSFKPGDDLLVHGRRVYRCGIPPVY
jgi:hypothetical protein